MKRSIFVICMVLCLLLCACGDAQTATESTPVATQNNSTTKATDTPTESTEETTEATTNENDFTYVTPTLTENTAFSAYKTFEMEQEIESSFWGGTVGVVINEPFSVQLEPTVRLREGDYDRLYIVPRFVGSSVHIYEIFEDEDGKRIYSEKPVYTVPNVEDGCIIYGAFERPEGFPKWYIEIITPYGIGDGLTLSYNGEDGTPHLEYLEGYLAAEKPVIYLYPEEETEVSVQLDYQGELTCAYPEYRGGWTVTAQPDGTLTDADGQTYNYLYWEGKGPADYDFSTGFCVKGEDSAAFLEEALEKLGLTRKEANEFIVYWLPRMQENEYNVISFQTDAYTETAPLTVTPAPDTMIRVYMAWYGSETAIKIAPQELTAPERNGFTVIEWGGCEPDSIT